MHEPYWREERRWQHQTQASWHLAPGYTYSCSRGAREAFTSLFQDVLGCDVSERDFGLEHPILLVAFGNGSRFSVEFTELAPPEFTGDVLDDERAFRGAWIEFRTTDRDEYQQKLRGAGIPRISTRGK